MKWKHQSGRYQDAVLAVTKAFALASASDEARDIRDEVGFVKTVRAALVKSVDSADSNGEPAILQSSKLWIVPSFQTRSLTYSPQQRVPG